MRAWHCFVCAAIKETVVWRRRVWASGWTDWQWPLCQSFPVVQGGAVRIKRDTPRQRLTHPRPLFLRIFTTPADNASVGRSSLDNRFCGEVGNRNSWQIRSAGSHGLFSITSSSPMKAKRSLVFWASWTIRNIGHLGKLTFWKIPFQGRWAARGMGGDTPWPIHQRSTLPLRFELRRREPREGDQRTLGGDKSEEWKREINCS